MIEALRTRFPDDTLTLHNLFSFLPSEILVTTTDYSCHQQSRCTVLRVCYSGNSISSKVHGRGVSPCKVAIREKEERDSVPSTAFEALEDCDEIQFPTINALLRILASLPASVASAERSFSTLRRLKTWPRSRMNEDRLTGLHLLNIHRYCSGLQQGVGSLCKHKA